jgi:hypothetical protein
MPPGVIKVPKASAWQPATVVSIREETRRVKTIRFAVSNWPGHLAGQHADVRLMAEDGYRAERSYSIASPPEVSVKGWTAGRGDPHRAVWANRNVAQQHVELTPNFRGARWRSSRITVL